MLTDELFCLFEQLGSVQKVVAGTEWSVSFHSSPSLNIRGRTEQSFVNGRFAPIAALGMLGCF
jgi:hypothetical protein